MPRSGAQGLGNLLGYVVLDKMLGTAVADSAALTVIPDSCATKLAGRETWKENQEDPEERKSFRRRSRRHRFSNSEEPQSQNRCLPPSFPAGRIAGVRLVLWKSSRPEGNGAGKAWNVALTLEKKALKKKPVESAYPHLADFIGNAKVSGAIIVVSEDAGKSDLDSLPATANEVLTSVQGYVDEGNRDSVAFAKGVNLFAAIASPKNGFLEDVRQALYPQTARKKKSLWIVKGGVDGAILKQVLADVVG